MGNKTLLPKTSVSEHSGVGRRPTWSVLITLTSKHSAFSKQCQYVNTWAAFLKISFFEVFSFTLVLRLRASGHNNSC